ncbi:MAG: hypothetical protein JRN24_03470 [Nitrososphaerota archaeon]|nr:hypothetical protein [Nitrososphaerota archaeon]
MEKVQTQCKAVDLMLNGGLAAGTVTQFFGEKVELDGRDLARSLAAAPFDLVVLEAAGQDVRKIGAYRSSERGDRCVLGGEPTRPITLWEAASIVGRRAGWTEPDEVTVFLSSLAATRGVSAGEKMVSVGDAASQTLLVRSLRTQPVELSRAQARLLMTVYS